MEFMEKRAKMKYPQYLPAMHAQASVISFYEKRGWEVVGKPFEEAGISHQVMLLLPKNFKSLKCFEDPETPTEIRNYLLKRQGL